MLAAVVVLEADDDAPEPRLERLSDSEVFEALARNSFDLPDDAPLAGLHVLERWSPVAGAVAGYRLSRAFGFEHVGATLELLEPLFEAAS